MRAYSFPRALTLACLFGLSLPLACGDDDDDAQGGAGTSGSANTAGNATGGSSSTAGTGGSSAAGNGANGGGGASGRGGNAGAGGTSTLPPGLSDKPSTEMCGADTCQSASVSGLVYVDPCCTEGDSCGLDTGFLAQVGASFDEVCQPLAQPGTLDSACEDATGLAVPFMGAMVAIDPFVGCCRPNGTCGVVVDKVTAKGVALSTFGLGCVDAAPFFDGNVVPCGGGEGGAGGAGGSGSAAGGEGPGAGAGGAGGSP